MERVGIVVQYFGVDIVIQYPFIATDEDGTVYEYRTEPELHESSGIFTGVASTPDRIGKVDLEGMDWKESLVEFEMGEDNGNM